MTEFDLIRTWALSGIRWGSIEYRWPELALPSAGVLLPWPSHCVEGSMTRYKSFLLLAAITGIAAGAYAQSTAVVKLPNEIEFKAPLGPGAQQAVLYGDPTKPGVYVQRVKFPAGLKVMPHWHPDEWRTAVVLSGTLYFGVGEQWDESKLKAYPTGTFYSEPPKTPHFLWAKDGEVIIQTTGMGPSATNMIPQKQ
jgi:quercetin dioxygenase-like cupin family protein